VTRFSDEEPGTKVFAVMGFDAAQKVFLGNKTVYGQAYKHTLRKTWGESVIVLDPPRHTPIRSLTVKALSKLSDWETNIIAPACDYLIDQIEAKGGGDLVSEYTGIVPLIVIGSLLDLDMSNGRWLLERINQVMAVAYNPEEGEAAAADIRAMFSDLYDERLKKPGEDLISQLIAAEVDGAKLSKEQVLDFCRILMPAGFETTSKQFGHLMTALLTHPEQMSMVRSDPALIPAAVEEVTRWESPLISNPKQALVDTTLAGVDIPAGAILIIFQGYVDRDSSKWERPHEFDISRPRRPTLAFGAGIHFCPGAQLARAELAMGTAKLLSRFPHLRLADPSRPPEIRGFYTRVVSSIPVTV